MSDGGKDARFFQTTKKGELAELKADLNSLDRQKVKDAVKKVIASMTIGKDVSSLFTDVVKSMQTESIELKKLVYLYIINYARSQPDKAILVVNTFQKDAQSTSPLIRALAIRTMGCIRVDRITEYLCEPLAKACKDKDPYVRKTAAIGIAKLFDINRELVEEQGFIDQLKDMISDSNPMVIANAVAALQEIQQTKGDSNDVFVIDKSMLNKLLAALNECTEWGQIFILDALAAYRPEETREAEEIIERVTPRLKHANSAVSMSAVKVILKYLPLIENEKLKEVLLNEKLPPPLITLLSEHKPEIQYVALRNINLIVQRHPQMLSNAVKHFFCKYNDPIYVKMEKLEILIQLASIKNVEKVLQELKEYAQEVDIEFVRKSVLAIGRCAIKIEKATEKCIQILLELIQTKVNYVVQEAIIVIKDIFRKYPNRYESIIGTLCENLESLDESEARASMIWIIGEYSDRIDNSPALLESFTEHFDEESSAVQLALLTAVVKLFLKRPEDAKQLVGQVLNLATQHADNPDLRDRGYIYWRLLSTDPEAAQQVVLADKPEIADDTFQLDPNLLETLIENISTLASIFHRPPDNFVKDHKSLVLKSKAKAEKKAKKVENKAKGHTEESESSSEESSSDENESSSEEEESDDEEPESSEQVESDEEEDKKTSSKTPAATVDLLNLGGLGDTSPAKPSTTVDVLGSTESPSSSFSQEPFHVALSSEQGKGLQLKTRVVRRNGRLFLDFVFENHSSQQLSQFAIKFNTNYLCLQPAGPLTPGTIPVGESKNFSLPLNENGQENLAANLLGIVQVAIKTELGVFYFNQPVSSYHLFTEDGLITDNQFINLWKAIADDKEFTQLLTNPSVNSIDDVKQKFQPFNIFFIASRVTNKTTNAQASYFSSKLKDVHHLIEVKLDSATQSQICVKSEGKLAQTVVQQCAKLLQ